MSKQDQAQAQPQVTQEAPPQAGGQKLLEQMMADVMAKVTSRREQEIRERVGMGDHGLWASNMNGLFELAKMVFRGGWAPKGFESAEACFLAMAKGAEIGLSHLASLQAIAPINGRPALWGDAMLGLCMASGKLEDYQVSWSGKPFEKDFSCLVRVKRRGMESWFNETFSVADADRAKLWGKQGPWTQYPKRMLEMRARGFALRNAFPDVLGGLISAEEAMDIPPDDGPGGGGFPDIQPGADPLSEAVATYGGGGGKAAPEPQGEPSTTTVTDEAEDVTAEMVDSVDPKPSQSSATISRSDLQRLRALAPKVLSCPREQVAQQIGRVGWGWNEGEPLGYAIESLETIPALDGMRMVQELEMMARELAAAEGGA